MWTILAGSIVATAGAVGALHMAWTTLGLPRIATERYVDALELRLIQRVADSERGLHELRIDALENRRNAVDRDVFDQRQRTKAVDDPDVKWRLHEKEEELKALDQKVDELRRQRK